MNTSPVKNATQQARNIGKRPVPASTATAQPTQMHPRLFFGPADVLTLRQRASTSHTALWAMIAAFAQDPANVKRPASAPANGNLDFYRSSGNQLLPLALTCVIENATAPCERAKAIMRLTAA